MKKSYRKKPVVIEAMQWDGTIEKAREIREALGETIIFEYETPTQTTFLKIRTLEGDMSATPGDYIVKGIKGECYPCKPDIFEASYEEVPDPTIAPHQQRLIVEEAELREKLARLRAFINTSPIFQRLSATEKTLLRAQESVMAAYHGILKQRLQNATYFQSEALTNLLIAYAEAVRSVTRDGKREAHEQALALYRELTGLLPAEDPRLKTVEQLKGLLDLAMSCDEKGKADCIEE